MAEVVVFHHALGLTPGVVAFADSLVASGHVVHTPDLYGGRRFPTLDAGVAHAEQVGFDRITNRGVEAVRHLGPGLVYVGFSLGVLPAQCLTQTRPGACGAIFVHSCVPADHFGPWPAGVPAQVHAMADDPWFVDDGDIDAARSLESEHGAEVFLYPGTAHLFADTSLDDYDPDAAGRMRDRITDFLVEVDRR